MRFGTRWIEATRRNEVKSTSGQKLRTAITGFTLWFTLIRSAKIVDRNFRMSDRNFGAGSANLQF
jgi:hypothetical protein